MAKKKTRAAKGRGTKTTRAHQEKPRRRPGPAATAPDPSIPVAGATGDASGNEEVRLSRGSALPSMLSEKSRERWGLPRDANTPGPYMIELNLRHPEGLAGAAKAFLEQLYPAVMGPNAAPPEQITSAYFRGRFTVPQWLELIGTDGCR
jgi:hypothetical protein